MTTQPHTFGRDNHNQQTNAYKCRNCRMTLKGGTTGDAVRAHGGGYKHPDPPGCKWYKDQATLAEQMRKIAQRPPQASSGRRRESGQLARASSSPRAKPPAKNLRRDPLPERTCLLEGCEERFMPYKENHKYHSNKCAQLAHRPKRTEKSRSNERTRVNENRRLERERKRAEEQAAILRGEHVHTGGTKLGPVVCHWGDILCETWNKQNMPPKECELPSCHILLDPKKKQRRYCCRPHMFEHQRLTKLLNTQMPGPDYAPCGVGWPIFDGRCI